MKEIWKDIKEYEGIYQVSNLGKVKRVKTTRVLKGCKDKGGYLRVNLSKNSVTSTNTLHRLVAEAFIPNPDNKPEVDHINENKTNNRVDNLEWTTRKDNLNYGTRNKRISKTQSVPIIATNIKTGKSTEFYGTNDCARRLGLYSSNITRVLKGVSKQTGGYKFKYKTKGEN